MNLELQGRVVVVTGGSKGIGLACARGFLEEGAQVALVSRSQANLESARENLGADQGRLLLVAANLIRPEEAEAMARRVTESFGTIDVLVNCAGAAKRYLPEELDAAAWRAAMDAKYFTYIHAMQAVLPAMGLRGRGVVVNVIGTGGKVPGVTHLPGGAANAALMLTTVGLAKVYAEKGIRIVGINPGATVTERLQQALALQARATGRSPEELLAQGEAAVPLGRYAKPEEIANLALFLSSDKASYITAAIIPMDGGATPAI
jgi:NAD(P)-dependent dehydrogenase (short-subunit alcohol dehydrogenase family)